MDGLLLPRRKEMGEIMESKIRKKDKVMSGRAGVGRHLCSEISGGLMRALGE